MRLHYVEQGTSDGYLIVLLEVVEHRLAKRGFALLPRHWVVECSFAWAARFRRLARDYKPLDTTLKAPLHRLRHPHDRKARQDRIATRRSIQKSNGCLKDCTIRSMPPLGILHLGAVVRRQIKAKHRGVRL